MVRHLHDSLYTQRGVPVDGSSWTRAGSSIRYFLLVTVLEQWAERPIASRS